MKKVLGWVKAHLVIVICGVLALVFIPAGLVGGHLWNKKVAAAAKNDFDAAKKQIDGAKRTTYSLPAIFEGEQALTETRTPNTQVTRFYAEQKRAREGQVTAVVERGVAFNKRDHEPLVSGLFPTASSERERRRLTRDLARGIVGDVDQPSYYRRLLEGINAGEPEPGEIVAQTLGEVRQREIERLGVGGASASGALPPEAQQQLTEEMARRRLGEYARRAAEISVYARAEAIFNDSPGPGQSRVPTTIPEDVPPPVAFTWQWDAWMVEDLLAAVARANTDPATGAATGVADSVVKRIDRITLERLDLSAAAVDDGSGGSDPFGGDPFGGGGGRDPFMSAGPAAGGPPGGEGRWGPTHTGRLGMKDELGDARMARLELVVSSERLPRLFDALSQTNLMTVTDVRLETIDPWAELKQGFYFGPEPVVRAVVDVETVWLRAWTAPLMPPPVRSALGVVLPEAPADGAEEGDGAAEGP